MSNGTSEPLPGLLDDPQFQIDLPWNDLPIAPLRNPGTQRNANAPSPLEPEAGSASSSSGSRRPAGHTVNQRSNITPSDVLQARESRKPHLAISELLGDDQEPDTHAPQLPSFVSLSVVEKSPTQQALPLTQYAHKRRFEDVEHTHDLGRQLPRPAQREQAPPRPAPRIPTMVTGLHEPPPSANLLPSMDADHRPVPARLGSTSKINVKDILMPILSSRSPSPTRQLPTPNSIHKHPSLSHFDFAPPNRSNTDPTPPTTGPPTPLAPHSFSTTITSTKEGNKPRRARRKWSEDETRHLLAGVRKHGVGKWKQILTDPTYTFQERSAVDLKDRYRVCSKDLDAISNVPRGGSVDSTSTATAPSAPTSTASAPTTAAAATSPASPVSEAPPSPNASPAPGTTTTAASGAPGVQQKQRRKRRAWTIEEDDALLRGVSKHGFQWTVIHDDKSLQLGHRRATDLRDRIRNKYPEGYRMAEVKPLRSEIRRTEKGKGRDDEDTTVTGGAAELDGGRARAGSRGAGEASRLVEPRKLAVVGGKGSNNGQGGGGGGGTGGTGAAGVTLPSLSLGDDMDLDADDGMGIRLPPLLPWDEMTN
jgi:hypothetical protein